MVAFFLLCAVYATGTLLVIGVATSGLLRPMWHRNQRACAVLSVSSRSGFACLYPVHLASCQALFLSTAHDFRAATNAGTYHRVLLYEIVVDMACHNILHSMLFSMCVVIYFCLFSPENYSFFAGFSVL